MHASVSLELTVFEAYLRQQKVSSPILRQHRYTGAVDYKAIGQALKRFREAIPDASYRWVEKEMKRRDPTGKGATHSWVRDAEEANARASLHRLELFASVVGARIEVSVLPADPSVQLQATTPAERQLLSDTDMVASMQEVRAAENWRQEAIVELINLVMRLPPDSVDTLRLLAERLLPRSARRELKRVSDSSSTAE